MSKIEQVWPIVLQD